MENHVEPGMFEGLHIFSLPTEVFFKIFDHLTYKQVNLFRQTCKKSSDLVDGYDSKLEKRLSRCPVAFSNEEDFNRFASSVKNIPFSHFQFSYPLRYKMENEMSMFMCQHGDRVKTLEIIQLHTIMGRDERNFFELMPNLKTLCVNRIKFWSIDQCSLPMVDCEDFQNSTNQNLVLPPSLLPINFKTLSGLKFQSISDPFLAQMILRGAPQLRTIFYGNYEETHAVEELENNRKTNDAYLNNLIMFYSKEIRNPKMSTYALGVHDLDLRKHSSEIIVNFVKAIATRHVNLLEIPSYFLCQLDRKADLLPDPVLQAFNNCILDINGICPCLSYKKLTSLVEITFHLRSYDLNLFQSPFADPKDDQWTALKKISFRITLSNADYNQHVDNIRSLWMYLFYIRRNCLKHLEVKMYIERTVEPCFCMFNPANMINLDTLILDIPLLSSGDYEILFQKLSEHTKIKTMDITFRCTFSSQIFAGEDRGHPTFLKLKFLKHCSLRVFNADENSLSLGLGNHLPNLSQEFIEDILPQSLLTCLVMSSNCESYFKASNSQMTESGINSIINGNLGTSLRYIFWNGGFGDITPLLTNSLLRLKMKTRRNKSYVVSSKTESCEKCQSF